MLNPARMFARLITGIAASNPTPSDETFTPIPIFPADSNAQGFAAGGVRNCCAAGAPELSAVSTAGPSPAAFAFSVEFPPLAPSGTAIAKDPITNITAHTAQLIHVGVTPKRNFPMVTPISDE